jgi:hypothetical protein
MQATKRVDDLSRIAQMLVDRPGLAHLSNEALLKQVGVQDRFEKSRKSGKSVAGALLKELGGTALTTVKVVGSTIAQVPVNGTGTHFLRGFRRDTYLQPTNGNQFSQFASFFGAGGVEGAPSAIKGQEIIGTVESALLDVSSSFQYNAPVRTSNFGIKNWNEIPNKKIEDVLPPLRGSELAKDGSIISVTQPQKVTQITGGGTAEIPDGVIELPTSSSINNETSRETTIAPGKLGRSVDNIVSNYHGPKGILQDIQDKSSEGSTYTQQKSRVGSKNVNVTKELRITLGDQGAISTDANYQDARRSNKYWIQSDTINQAEVDKLNALDVQNYKVDGETVGRDIVKFRFHVITPDESEKVLYFRAYLDSFADNYSAQWNPVKYLGRAEDFQIYGGFQRKITLSFKIAAATRAEMKSIYRKMVYLASTTAPTYADGGQFMRGTLTKMTVGDYVYEQPGVLNSVNYTWNIDYPWEIAMNEPEKEGDQTMQELPMVMDCSIDFTPIHTFTPTTGIKNKLFTASELGKPNYFLD